MEDELIRIWQSSPEIEQIKFEKSRLMLDMENSLDRFHRLVKYGILIEQIAVYIIIPVFLFYIYIVPPILAKVASLLIAIWAGWYLFLLRKFKKSKPKTVTLNYLEYLKKNRTYMNTLKNWVEKAMYWYILPPMTGYLLFIAGHYFEGMINNSFLVKLILLGIGLSIAYFFYFKWAIKKIYAPRLKKIDELIKVMEEY